MYTTKESFADPARSKYGRNLFVDTTMYGAFDPR